MAVKVATQFYMQLVDKASFSMTVGQIQTSKLINHPLHSIHLKTQSKMLELTIYPLISNE